jgi:hypothetical protein
MTTRFEDERNDIREYYFFDPEMNRALLESYNAQGEPEAYVNRKSQVPFSYISKPVARVTLDIGFYFKKETTSPLMVVFWFRVSHQHYSRKGEVERVYNGDRTEAAFNSYSSQYLQSARTIIIAACDAQALENSNIKLPISVAVFVSKIYYEILKYWSELK